MMYSTFSNSSCSKPRTICKQEPYICFVVAVCFVVVVVVCFVVVVVVVVVVDVKWSSNSW